MQLSLVFYAFLARTAIGTIAALIPLWAMRPAERPLRFQCLLALVLGAGAAAFYGAALGEHHPEFPRGLEAFLSFEGALPGFLVLFCVFCLLTNLFYGTFHRRTGRIMLALGVLAGLVAILGTGRFSAASESTGAWLVLGLSGFLGGLVMASILNAMIVGHFYLMIKGLPMTVIKRAGWFVAGALAARMLLFGLVLLFWEGADTVLLEQEMIWTAWRVAFGFVGPLTLLWMVSDTVRLQHTQAATGLLYVAVAFGLMGELAAVYLELQTGIPA